MCRRISRARGAIRRCGATRWTSRREALSDRPAVDRVEWGEAVAGGRDDHRRDLLFIRTISGGLQYIHLLFRRIPHAAAEHFILVGQGHVYSRSAETDLWNLGGNMPTLSN